MRASFGSLTVDTDARRLDRDGAELHLTPKAFDLLALLLEAAPKVVSKRDLHARLWPDSFVADATLVGLVKEVRRVLQQRGADPVRTYHRVGYAFTGLIARRPLEDRAEPHQWIVRGRHRFALRPGANVIGRDPSSAVWLDVAGVSRRHACVIVTGDSATLEDLGSKNGTLRRGERVATPVNLRDGDQIQVAGVVLVFRESTTNRSTETQRSRRYRKARVPASSDHRRHRDPTGS